MGTINTAFVLGNLGATPELQRTADGHAHCMLSIATHRRCNPDDRSERTTTWHKVKLWRHNAEFASQYLRTGDPVAIEGRIQHDEWIGRDGTERSQTVIVGSRVTLVGRRDDREEERAA